MRKCVDFLKQLGRDEEGTALIEYSILLGVIALAVITAAVAIGGWVSSVWSGFCGDLQANPGGGTAPTAC